MSSAAMSICVIIILVQFLVDCLILNLAKVSEFGGGIENASLLEVSSVIETAQIFHNFPEAFPCMPIYMYIVIIQVDSLIPCLPISTATHPDSDFVILPCKRQYLLTLQVYKSCIVPIQVRIRGRVGLFASTWHKYTQLCFCKSYRS